MLDAIKVIIFILLLFLLVFPMLPIRVSGKKIGTFKGLSYGEDDNKNNVVFVIATFIEFILICVVFALVRDEFSKLIQFIYDSLNKIPLVQKWFKTIIGIVPSRVQYIIFVIGMAIINIAIVLVMLFVKGVVRNFVGDLIFRTKKQGKNKKKGGAVDQEQEIYELDKKKKKSTVNEKEEEAKKRKKLRIPLFVHSPKNVKDKVEETTGDNTVEQKKKQPCKAWGLFFKKDDYIVPHNWVVRVESVLQIFIYLVEILYLILFALMLLSVFYSMPKAMYTFLINWLKVEQWYVYPLISIIFLQEICDMLHSKNNVEEAKDAKELTTEAKEEKNREFKIRSLQGELKRRFDSEHSLRYYPAVAKEDGFEYVCTNKPYASALQYIKNQMKLMSGRVVNSYMECLDSIYNENNVYFCASFYSEFGEYLIAYTYTRLLAGSRQIFIVSDRTKVEALRKYVNERLMRMTGCSENSTWRVYVRGERLDQADVLIACPEDFKDDNIVEHYPGFFEEVANAIFIDADRVVSLESYLCPVMSIRLQKATNNRICFVFLTKDIYKGFAESSLPKFFSLDSILSFSSAKENETVSYTLWNRESKSNRIYDKNGQYLTSLDVIVAELAYNYGIDGVRLITNAPIGHAEKKLLTNHNVEINEFYKAVPEMNYMIYSDDACNLAASLYACTRFRGKKKSAIHIISKPYLLREFFIAKTASEDYINRFSFIQPRVTEHASNQKLAFLRLYCEVTSMPEGIPVDEYEDRMRNLILTSRNSRDIPACAFCKNLEGKYNLSEFNLHQLVSYMLAALYDSVDTPLENSIGYRSRDYYLITNPINYSAYSIKRGKYITFKKVKDIFEGLFVCNERVSLSLNGKIIGTLDTFPSRVPLEFIVGQSLMYNNTEYEIDQISDDNKTIFLRRENVTFRNCLDTIFLRRYGLEILDKIDEDGVLYNSKSILQEIRVSLRSAKVTGETYGYYTLMSDCQTLNFETGVQGNPHVDRSIVDKNIRRLDNTRVLKVDLTTRMTCTDGMRMLLSAVFNEFIKTIFPNSYRCVAICPILENPIKFNENLEADNVDDYIKTLYPYIKNAQGNLVEDNPNRMQFVFINDCCEDIGIFGWFYDRFAHYMQEFLANVYSYLHWLKERPTFNHYIYFGKDKLADCYDLDGCCALFEGYNFLLSDGGQKDFETAGKDKVIEGTEYCSFCHKLMEWGRFSFFDDYRYICADCFDVVSEQARLDDILYDVKEYLTKKYPSIIIGTSNAVLEEDIFHFDKKQELSEYFYRLDNDNRLIHVELDNPVRNVEVSVLRGIIGLWQFDNDLLITHANAQLYYEEVEYLKEKGDHFQADWVYNNIDENTRLYFDEIVEFVKEGIESGNKEKSSSFSYMRTKAQELEVDDIDEITTNEEYSDELYDPNKIPRFLKRYLRGISAQEGTDTLSDEDREDKKDEVVEEEATENAEEEVASTKDMSKLVYAHTENAPPINEEENLDSSNEIDENFLEEETNDYFEEDINEPQETIQEEIDEIDEEDITFEDEESDEIKFFEKTPKKKGILKNVLDFFTKKKKASEEEENSDKEEGEENKAEGKGKKKKIKLTTAEKLVPFEEDEDTNPQIHLYNEILRHAYNYSEESFNHGVASFDIIEKVFTYVIDDYPELFWVHAYKYNDTTMSLVFRCKDADGKLDVKQINKKRAEIQRGAKFFTRGITKKTNPYQAALTIYRRLILTLDYDGIGLASHADNDTSKDDVLRSLHSALVKHKVVCAGYAVAMQYLLQSVGISCSYISSNKDNTGGTHAFNVLKIGKYCYYLDATWGDYSNTEHANNKDDIRYDYFCVPYDEFVLTGLNARPLHEPNCKIYPEMEKFNCKRHEYYRYHNAYVTKYDEQKIAEIFANTALKYNRKEMGNFTVSFRCAGYSLAKYIYEQLVTKGKVANVKEKAKALLGNKHKGAIKLINSVNSFYSPSNTGVICCLGASVKDLNKQKN